MGQCNRDVTVGLEMGKGSEWVLFRDKESTAHGVRLGGVG